MGSLKQNVGTVGTKFNKEGEGASYNDNFNWCMLSVALLCRNGHFCVEPCIFMSNWAFCVVKIKHFPRYWRFVLGIHRSRWLPLTKAGTWSFGIFFICTRTSEWINNWNAGDLKPHRSHCDVTVMFYADSCIGMLWLFKKVGVLWLLHILTAYLIQILCQILSLLSPYEMSRSKVAYL